jgi:SAM-dependent methyltransferase
VEMLRKVKNAGGVARMLGLSGLVKTAKDSLSRLDINDASSDLLGNEPMFRYATCNDLITLMAKYPQYCREGRDSDKSHAWGLKAMGTLFCSDRVARLKPAKVLEVGAGWNRHFDTHFGAATEYWMVDEASDIGWDKESREKFEVSMQKRQNTHFVRGLLGSFLPELPDQAFDMLFSISVIEHVPPEAKTNFYKDMFRVLKPGGMIVHSIDIPDELPGRAEFEAIVRAGFRLPKKPDLRIRVRPTEGNPTLFEDLWTVYNGYLGLNRADKWEKPSKVPGQYTTILVVAQKPAGK